MPGSLECLTQVEQPKQLPISRSFRWPRKAWSAPDAGADTAAGEERIGGHWERPGLPQ